jgi:hypothetical protein
VDALSAGETSITLTDGKAVGTTTAGSAALVCKRPVGRRPNLDATDGLELPDQPTPPTRGVTTAGAGARETTGAMAVAGAGAGAGAGTGAEAGTGVEAEAGVGAATNVGMAATCVATGAEV